MNEKKEMQKEKALISDGQYTPSALLALAIQKDIDLERLKTLMDLQERYDANEAKKAFTKAMTDFKMDPPKIIKDMTVEYMTSKGKTSYSHASLGNVVGAITEGLSKHQMSVNWKTKQENGKIEVTCFLTHVQGHTESTSLNASPDISGKKNPIQAVGSASTYLKRYTLLDIVGLATNECETDGNISEPAQKAGKKPAQKNGSVPNGIVGDDKTIGSQGWTDICKLANNTKHPDDKKPFGVARLVNKCTRLDVFGISGPNLKIKQREIIEDWFRQWENGTYGEK